MLFCGIGWLLMLMEPTLRVGLGRGQTHSGSAFKEFPGSRNSFSVFLIFFENIPYFCSPLYPGRVMAGKTTVFL